ncbi:hypothetical protein ACFV5N_07835 [Streptomyces sp. NPDC059853]|uniref:hypothetical protein n=1 Tax=Streptomyces sp. NPDC059853 TaxID=3346973 RepID=UPI00364F586B
MPKATTWTWARSVSCPVSKVCSSRTPPKSIWSAMAPATATVMPLTAREAGPLPSWSRRTASCQETGPPRRAPTHRSTIHGRNAVAPTRTSTMPAPAWISRAPSPLAE